MRSVFAWLCIFIALAISLPAQSRYPTPARMLTVHIALLLKGPNTAVQPKAEADALQSAHLAHLGKLAAAGQAYIAGPIGDAGDFRGIVLLKAPTADAARALEADDPAVKAGHLRIEMVSYTAPGNWFSFSPIPADYKMRTFVFGFLMNGAKFTGTAEQRAKIQDEHFANTWALREAGTLISAGPTVDDPARAGVLIFALDSVEKARELFAQDPLVKSGLFTLELYKWYAADGIIHGK